MKKIRVVIVCAAAIVLVACSFFAPGEEFTGIWVADNGQECFEIARSNGKEFLVRRTAPSFFDGKVRTETFKGYLFDKTLTIDIVLLKVEASVVNNKLIMRSPFSIVFTGRKGTKDDIAQLAQKDGSRLNGANLK